MKSSKWEVPIEDCIIDGCDIVLIGLQEAEYLTYPPIDWYKKVGQEFNYQYSRRLGGVLTLIISKQPLKIQHFCCGLSLFNLIDKGFIISTIKLNDYNIMFTNLHLASNDSNRYIRSLQLKKILNLINNIGSGYSTLLSGDFNFRVESELRFPFEDLKEIGTLDTYTYKYLINTNTLDSKRIPAITDRILTYKSTLLPSTYCTYFKCVPSDHKPIYGQVTLTPSDIVKGRVSFNQLIDLYISLIYNIIFEHRYYIVVLVLGVLLYILLFK